MKVAPQRELSLLGELIRLTAPPAGENEVCEQGLAIAAKGVGASAGTILLGSGDPGEFAPACAWGRSPTEEMIAAGRQAIARSGIVQPGGPGGRPARVAVPLPGSTGPVGALVLENPHEWSEPSEEFARHAARILSGSLLAARMLRESRAQGELLARRNLELEALRELNGRLQDADSDEAMLQGALDLVLEKLALESGWIFWGESEGARFQLAAWRGISPVLVEPYRAEGVDACLCKEVFSSGRTLIARNTVDCPRLPGLLGPDGPLVHACIPLKFERGIHGVMNIANRPGQLFSPQDLRFLETVGHQVCLAVDKARTSRAEGRRNAESRALASLARAIGGSLEQDRVLAAVGDYARELLRADRCAIFLGDGSAPPLFAYLSGPPLPGLSVGQPANLKALQSRGPLTTLRTGRTLTIEDASDHPHANPELARRWGVGSALLVPLVAHEHPQGVLFVARGRQSSWGDEEVEMANALAGQAALAIENARLYNEMKDALVRLQAAQYGMMRAERMAAVGTLASSLAHEVRNPLNSIHLQLVLLTRRAANLELPARAELTELVETARREIARLDTLVEEFLSLSSLDRLQAEATPSGEIVREVFRLMAPAAQEKGLVAHLQIADDLPPLRLDREKIKQVLINLVRNAIEAMPGGGTLTLSCRTDPNGFVVMSVADTGHGIEPGLDVFDFFMTTKRGGTGLGLAISRRIVEAHGGSLNYASEIGVGTTFMVTFKPPKPGDMQ